VNQGKNALAMQYHGGEQSKKIPLDVPVLGGNKKGGGGVMFLCKKNWGVRRGVRSGEGFVS